MLARRRAFSSLRLRFFSFFSFFFFSFLRRSSDDDELLLELSLSLSLGIAPFARCLKSRTPVNVRSRGHLPLT